MLDFIRLVYTFSLSINSLYMVKKINGFYFVCLGSVLMTTLVSFNASLIYLSLLYHYLMLIILVNRNVKIDLSLYAERMEQFSNSVNDEIAMASLGYNMLLRQYFGNRGDDRFIRVTFSKYFNRIGRLFQLVTLASCLYLKYIGRLSNELMTIYCFIVIFRAILTGKIQTVRNFFWLSSGMFFIYEYEWLKYPLIYLIVIISNEIFQYGLPDKFRMMLGENPTRYCKYCKDQMPNNLLESVLLDHNRIAPRPNNSCYCRLVYQYKMRYWFDSITGGLMATWLLFNIDQETRVWIIMLLLNVHLNKLIKLVYGKLSDVSTTKRDFIRVITSLTYLLLMAPGKMFDSPFMYLYLIIFFIFFATINNLIVHM